MAMAVSPVTAFELPDTIAALPRRPFQFSAAAIDEADAIVAGPAEELFRRLLADQESEAALLAARRVLDAFLPAPSPPELGEDATADEIAALVAGVRHELGTTLTALATAEPATRELVIRQRAPLGLLGGCWLDVVSQPATQPSIIVNRLFEQHYALRGAGNPRRSLAAVRRRRMEESGVYLPDLAAADFLARAGARPLTALHGGWYLALSRLPASFLPELVGVHYAVLALGVDDLLLGQVPPLSEPDLRAVLAAYLDLAGPAERARLHAGLRLALDLEREHVGMLAELADWHRGLTLESRVAAIVARHAPFAGRQHRDVRVGGRRLADRFTDPELDLAEFLRELRESPQLRRTTESVCSLVKALKFGGPMFGIFDAGEAEVFQAWAESVQAGERPDIVISACTAGDERAAARAAAIAASAPADVVIAEAGTPGDRELFYRLINIENFASTRPLALARAERLLTEAEVLFDVGADGRYTDASYFDYRPEALYERCERVYFDKLIRPYEPLTAIPDRDVVVFLQTTYALGALVDAAWIHRMANLGRAERSGDAALFAIYADEVGHGDLRKTAFMEQGDLPDELYGFSLHQLCMALFPDTFYNEILGYNLAIEMFGLGELRLHEVQKLRHYGFDDCYEQAHLTIDNLSAGHSRQAADIIVTYLDEVGRTLGEAAVQREWRRVWRGYASLAWFVEHALLKRLAAGAEAGAGAEAAEAADLLI
jgi:Iron-containing redox enzyme